MLLKVTLILTSLACVAYSHLTEASEIESFTGTVHHDIHHHDILHDHGDHLHQTHHDVVVSTPQATGFWKKRFVWKPRWVKSWQEKKIYVGVWKRVWGPVQVTEWVPIPRPPPGWSKHH